MKFDALEIARVIGQPVDPRKPYSNLVNAICETDTADASDYVYSYDVNQDTDYIYTITSTGAITDSAVTPDTPTVLTFADIASPHYYVKITDLAKAMEKTLARKKATINRALNAEENYQVVQLLDAAAVGRGNVNDLKSGETSFNYAHVIDMIFQLIDYAEDYVLVEGNQIAQDIKLWDWTDNKYHSLKEAFADLGIEEQRVNQTVTRDGTSTSVLASTTAYLVGRKTEEPTRPILWVRKRLDDVSRLGGVIYTDGDKPERLVFVTPNPILVSSTRYLAVGITGFEEYTCATTNSYAVSRFLRTV